MIEFVNERVKGACEAKALDINGGAVNFLEVGLGALSSGGPLLKSQSHKRSGAATKRIEP